MSARVSAERRAGGGVGCESRDMERVGDEGRRREKHRAMGVGAECQNDVERRVWGALAA